MYKNTLNINTQKSIHIICVYKVHSWSIFIKNFQTKIQKFYKHCPIIIMGKFNVDILKDNNQTKKEERIIIFHE